MRLELLQLFANVTSARGLTGSVAFQVAPPSVPTETSRTELCDAPAAPANASTSAPATKSVSERANPRLF